MEFLDPAMELRKLRPSHVKELAKTLESGESWKNLMSRIPERLDRFDYNCDISVQNRNKYHSEHYRLIQSHSERTRTSCTEILFDEWGTSGRVRPTLGHLLHLLTKAELFRAADYLAQLLNQPKPPRPTSGPARRINVELEEVEEVRNVEEVAKEEVSEYVKDAIQLIRRKSEEAAKTPQPRTIPVIKISLSVDEDENPECCEGPVPMVVPKQLSNARKREVSEQTERKGAELQKVQVRRETVVSRSENENVASEISEPLPQLPEAHVPVNGNGNMSESNLQKITETPIFASEDSEQLPDFQKINKTSSVTSGELPDFRTIQSEVSYEVNESINHSLVSEVSQQLPNFQKINEVSHTLSYESAELPDFSKINNVSEDFQSGGKQLPDFSHIYTISEDVTSALPNFSEINRSSETLSSKHVETSDLSESSGSSKVVHSSEISENTNVSEETPGNGEGSEVVGVSSEQLPYFSGLLTSGNCSGESPEQLPNTTHNLHNPENLPIEEEEEEEENASSWNSSRLPNSAESFDNLSSHLPNFNETLSNSTTPGCSLKCSSPLPQLSLRTSLPHIPYSTLAMSTNNFNSANFSTPEMPGRLLGSGAFGSVFVGFGLLSVPVAIKKLKLESLVRDITSVELDDTVTKQFRNEVEVLSRYEHENLLSLLGYSCDGCTYCLVYEYIPGGALKDRLMLSSTKPLDWKTRLQIAIGTARSIAYLHTAFDTPLVHRDIKSANILLDASDYPKLGDFGLIRLSSSSTVTTDSCAITTTIFGTSAYMAPEAFGGDVSIKMDVFSFGVVLLELLTSLPAMDIQREDRDLVTHIKSNCDSPDDILTLLDTKAGIWEQNNINFGKEIYNIASKCLEIKKKRPSMVEVRNLLEGLLKKL